jgi:hypothetical protein
MKAPRLQLSLPLGRYFENKLGNSALLMTHIDDYLILDLDNAMAVVQDPFRVGVLVGQSIQQESYET